MFNWRLAKAIEATGKTQRQLAADLGIAQSTLSGYVTLHSYPRPTLLERVATYLAVPADLLFPACIAKFRLLRQPARIPLCQLGGLPWLTKPLELGQPAYVAVEKAHMVGTLRRTLDTLPPRERQVLVLRFGLEDDGRSRTLEEVGRELGVTRERIRQLEDKALRKLRHPSRTRLIKDFLD